MSVDLENSRLMRCDVNAEVLTATQTQAVCDVKDIFLVSVL